MRVRSDELYAKMFGHGVWGLLWHIHEMGYQWEKVYQQEWFPIGMVYHQEWFPIGMVYQQEWFPIGMVYHQE
jgi:hypothetical protein